MKKFVGLLTNTFTDLNNVRLTKQVIMDILERQPVVPITVNFNGVSVGRTISFYADGNMIGCHFELEESKIPELITKGYIVPGMDNVEYHNEGRTRVIDRGDLTEVSISLLPANPSITRIKSS